MNTYKHWKANGDTLSQEPDRPRHKRFTSSSHHRTSEIRTAGRDREDAKHRSSRAHVSDGPLLSTSTPAPTYPSGAQSSATASKAPHNAPTQPVQGYTSHMSQKAPHPIPTLPQETHHTAQRHWETLPDPRATSHRTVTAMDKASLMSPDPLRHAEDHYKSSRHRPRHPPLRLPKAQSLKLLLLGLAHRHFLKKQVQKEKKERRNRVGIGQRKSQKPLLKQKTSGAQSDPKSRFLEISENGTPGTRKRDGITKRNVGVSVRRKGRGRSSVMMKGATNRGSRTTMPTTPLETRRHRAKLTLAIYLTRTLARTQGLCVSLSRTLMSRTIH